MTRLEKEKEVNRIIKNYNAKISREIKKNQNLSNVYIPKLEKVDYKNITTRELKKLQNRAKKVYDKNFFNVVDNKIGLKTTEGVIKEVRNQTRIINIKTARQQQEAFKRGKTDIPINKMGKPIKKRNQLKVEQLTPDYLKHLVEKLNRESTGDLRNKEVYKNNYIQAVLTQYGNTKKSREVISLIKQIPIEIIEATYESNPTLHIGFVYGEKDDKGDRLDIIIQGLNQLGYFTIKEETTNKKRKRKVKKQNEQKK